jgi:hypothetical protein
MFHQRPTKTATYSISQTVMWLPISVINDYGFNLLLFKQGIFVLNPNPISMANNGMHEGPSPLVRLFLHKRARSPHSVDPNHPIPCNHPSDGGLPEGSFAQMQGSHQCISRESSSFG